MAKLETSQDNPVPLRVIAARIAEWINRLGEVWLDGQVAQLSRRPGVATQFMTLRDPDANISINVTCNRATLPPTLTEGARVTVLARPDFWIERGTLSLRASAIHQVGLGELLARLEQRRRQLAAEGLFAADRKRSLPFLPRRIGLITGRASAAERDVVENTQRRFAGIGFEIRNVATQGPTAVEEVVAALISLDADPEVEVIVIARGGGSVEDLLPFSSETLIRAVAAAMTPVVSAIGHEPDAPLLDFVADVAASTPTDAAKHIVPDLAEELRLIATLRHRCRDATRRRLSNERQLVEGLPHRLRTSARGRFVREASDVQGLRTRGERRFAALLHAGRLDIEHVRARVVSLSPQATLDRGYAVVQNSAGIAVREPTQAEGQLRITVSGGTFTAMADAPG
jgi:exodeoxyribonuclease VII large subunit